MKFTLKNWQFNLAHGFTETKNRCELLSETGGGCCICAR